MRNLQSSIACCLCVLLITVLFHVNVVAQNYRALATDISEPIYHVFSSKDYPCIALSNDKIYKVFGKTMIECPLPQSLSLDGSESTTMISSDKEIYIAQETGGIVINFSSCNNVSISKIMDKTQIDVIGYDGKYSLLYANDKGVYRKKFDKPPVAIINGDFKITSCIPTNQNSNFVFADINNGVYQTFGDSLAHIYQGDGVTALDYTNQNLYINQGGQIRRITNKGSDKLLTTLPAKYKSISTLYYDNDYNLWIQGEDLFAFNMTDKSLHKVVFDGNPDTYDVTTASGNTYIGTENGLYIFTRTLEQIVHTKDQKGLPLLYSSENQNLVVDDGRLYNITKSSSQKLAFETNIEYPVESNDGWWVKLKNKLIKVNDKYIPPIQAPSDTVTYICDYDRGKYAIGTSKGLFLQDTRKPSPDLHTIEDKHIHMSLVLKRDSNIISATDSQLYDTDLITGISTEQSGNTLCPAFDIVLKDLDTIYKCTDKLIIKSSGSQSTIRGEEDLLTSKILDIEIIKDNCYILTQGQLIKGSYSEFKNGNFTNISRYLTFYADKGRITYQNGLLLLETPTDVSYINPSRLTTHLLTPEVEPKFTYEYEDVGLKVFDQKSDGKNGLRYEDDDGEWASVENHTIPYKYISDEGIKIQKKNLFGEWVPYNVNPVSVIPERREPKTGWILLSLGLIGILILISWYFRQRHKLRISA